MMKIKLVIFLLLSSSVAYGAQSDLDTAVASEIRGNRDNLVQALCLLHGRYNCIVINYYKTDAIKEAAKKNKPVLISTQALYDCKQALEEYSSTLKGHFFVDQQQCVYEESEHNWKDVARRKLEQCLIMSSYFIGQEYITPPETRDFEIFMRGNFDDNNNIILNIPDDCDIHVGYNIESNLKENFGQLNVGVIGEKKKKAASFFSVGNISVLLIFGAIIYFVHKNNIFSLRTGAA